MKAAAHTPHSRLSSEATCLTEMVSVSMMESTTFILRDRELTTMFMRRQTSRPELCDDERRQQRDGFATAQVRGNLPRE